MKAITADDAQDILQKLLEETTASHQPIQITSEFSSAVLISEEDWRSIQETLFLVSMPGMRESIRDGMNTPIEECSKELTW